MDGFCSLKITYIAPAESILSNFVTFNGEKYGKNEIRVLKITGSAIDELMWELLNKSGDQFLDFSENSETIFHLNWDKEKDELMFYAVGDRRVYK